MMTQRTAHAVSALIAGCLIGAAVAVATRLVAPTAGEAARASAAVAVAIGVVACCAPLVRGGAVGRAVAAGLGGALALFVAAWGCGVTAPAVAAVGTGVATLAAGVTAAALRLGGRFATARLLGAATPLVLLGSVFVADPFVEWNGSRPASVQIARTVYALNPLASATAPAGGTGVDWQTRGWMYDGEGGEGGLSRIGQFYPSRPARPVAWGAVATLVGLCLTGAATWRRPVAPGT